jgi:hypothetical protein
MSALKESIVEKLDALPEPALRQVLDFVSCLVLRDGPEEASVLTVAGQLSGDPMSAAQIEAALYGESHRGAA